MKNPIRQWLQKRQQKKASKQNLRWLQSVAQQHQWLDQLRTSGLLQWDVVQRRLFIEADLAVLFLQDAQRWTAFIHNTYQWLYYLESQSAVEDYMHQEELKAVRDAMANGQSSARPNGTLDPSRMVNGQLSRSDIDRIRRHRRAEIMQSDVPTPQVEHFEFFIVRSDEPSTAAAQASGRLIAVGHYDPDTQHMEIAPWEDIKDLLQQKKE
jgi:hypothetical protein